MFKTSLLIGGIVSCFLGYTIYKNYKNLSLIEIAKKIPQVNNMIVSEKKKLRNSLKKYISPNTITRLPNDGTDNTIILEKFNGKNMDYKNTGAIYIQDDKLDDLIIETYKKTLRTNPLHASLFYDILKSETEIVRMVADLFNGDNNVVGNVVTGGTDSIRHAVYCSRERAKIYGISSNWEIIIPTTAHPAFRKAANEYSIIIKECPIDINFRMNLNYLTKMITKKTILVVGSCPSFPHGTVDPIEDISDILTNEDENNIIGLHVDCCLGSLVVPFVENIYTKFDFSVPRVTSISIDTHKYGYTDKGSSVILYKNHDDWRKHQIFVDSQWCGGIYATPTLSGSRSGKDIAGTLATLLYIGKDKYIMHANNILHVADQMREVINEFDELELLGIDNLMVVTFMAKNNCLNIYDLKTEMSNKGWYFASLQGPAALHFCVTAVHTQNDSFIEEFKMDLADCLGIIKNNPNINSNESVMYCSNNTMIVKEFVPELSREYWNILNNPSN